MQVLSGNFRHFMRCLQHFFHEVWNPDQFLDQGLPCLVREQAQFSADPKAKKEEDHQLSGKGLGRRHANLRACMGVNDMIRLSCQARLHHIADG